jgi:SAM-dependent methyltransferase
MNLRKYWKQYWNKSNILKKYNEYLKVGRSRYGIPIDDDTWKRTCEYIVNKLEPNSEDTCLDLCCGNGLLEKFVVDYFGKIVSVDFSHKLLDNFVIDNEKIIKIEADALYFDIKNDTYDSIVLYFAAQHFDEISLINIVERSYKGLHKGGKMFIGDIPDINKRWDFYKTKENRNFYFNSLSNNNPHIGFWHDPLFFKFLAKYLDFSTFEYLEQPEYQINSSYRFDVVLTK